MGLIRMSSYTTQLLILTSVACLVQAKCGKYDQEPKVTVKNSSHIFVSWENSFEDCDKVKVQGAFVKILSDFTSVNFSDGVANVKANPCLTHHIIVVLEYKTKHNSIIPVWSQLAPYNDNVLDIKSLYAGLLQEKVVDEICLNKNRTFSIPDISEEI